MLKRNLIPVWVGILLLSGMFLLGQDTWPPPCTDLDGDGYGSPASAGCVFPAGDCDDADPEVHPWAIEAGYADSSCVDGLDNDCDGSVDAGDTGCGAPFDNVTPSAAYLSRKAEYLQYCHDSNGPGQGGLHGQVCRIALDATTFNEEDIDSACDKINERRDTADFAMASVLRLLYLDRDHPTLSPETRAQLEEAVIGFKYWYDEPGDDPMITWSENHIILFHHEELLAGQLFPEEVFPNNGMTGAEHVAHATPLVHRWLNFRGRFGFSEWHSNVYFNEDIPALVNLADFAGDEEIRIKAAMVLDTLAFDLINNTYKGLFATAHGRTYPGKLLDGLNDSTREATWMLAGLGNYSSGGNFSGAFLATSPNYAPPPVLEGIAADSRDGHEHRQRDGIDLADGPDWGIGFQKEEDIVFWWGMTGYAAHQVIGRGFEMWDTYNLWEAFFSGILPPELRGIMELLVGCPLLPVLSEGLEPMTRGVALETMGTYTYRTPHYQLSGAQDYNPAMWGAQIHIWQATLDADAYVFTTYPGGLVEWDYDMAGLWTGGWLPRATFHRNVGVIQYYRPIIDFLEDIFVEYTHAHFPKNMFDEYLESAPWVFGRKGDGYVALYSLQPTVWSTENDYELIADGLENVWIVELGSVEESGTFADFIAGIQAAGVSVGDTVIYASPSVGTVEAGREGPMTVAGEEVDLGPYPRWDNPYAHQGFGTNTTVIAFDGQTLELDFERIRRSQTP